MERGAVLSLNCILFWDRLSLLEVNKALLKFIYSGKKKVKGKEKE